MAGLYRRWAKEEQGTALMETIILFPILLTLMMGCFDLGQGIALSQKTIAASQIMGDLIARNRSVTMDMVDDVIKAGELSFAPYSTDDFGYDIVSVRFNSAGAPVVLWRVTENMDPNDEAVSRSQGLGSPGAGLIVVSARYEYEPYFTNFWMGNFDMTEVAFLRGRRSSTITCTDC